MMVQEVNIVGIGKPRSKLGTWLDERGIRQEWLVTKSGISKTTISNLCNEEDYIPSGSTMKKIIIALQTIDQSVKGSQFWDL